MKSKIASVLLCLFLLAACNEENSALDVNSTESKTQLFDAEILSRGQIHCLASAGSKGRLIMIAFKFSENEVSSSQEAMFQLGGNSPTCDLSKLTDSGLNNFSVAQKEVELDNHLSFRLQANLKSHPEQIGVSMAKFEVTPHEDFLFEVESIVEQCAELGALSDDQGLRLFKENASCERSKPHYSLRAPYIFSGVVEEQDNLSIISCTDKAGAYPNGGCFVETWYNGRSISILISRKHFKNWKTIRREVFSILDKRLVLLIGDKYCTGKYCTK